MDTWHGSIHRQQSFERILGFSDTASTLGKVNINKINENLDPGRYSITFEIKDPTTHSVFEKSTFVEIPEICQDGLLLSDIELAFKMEPLNGIPANEAFVKNDMAVMPYPSTSFSKRQSIGIYFEIYNLLLDGSGMTGYTVEYELKATKMGFLRKLFSLGRRAILSSSYDRRGGDRQAREYFSIDFGKVKVGEYLLSVQVKDLIGNLTKRSELRVEVTE